MCNCVVFVICLHLNNFQNQISEKITTILTNPVSNFYFLKIMTTRFRHISAYYEVISNCERVSLLQFFKFIVKS